MDKSLIILAGGIGRRFNGDLPKQYFADYNGTTILKKSALPFRHLSFKKIIIVCDLQYKTIINDELSFFNQNIIFCKGGSTRMQSIVNGLKLIDDASHVFIQESVRPYVDKDIIDNLVNAPEKWVAVAPGVTPSLLYGEVDLDSMTCNHIFKKKDTIVFQLPRRYRVDILKESIAKLNWDFKNVDDESQYILKFGYEMNVINGSHDNIKITFPFHKALINK